MSLTRLSSDLLHRLKMIRSKHYFPLLVVVLFVAPVKYTQADINELRELSRHFRELPAPPPSEKPSRTFKAADKINKTPVSAADKAHQVKKEEINMMPVKTASPRSFEAVLPAIPGCIGDDATSAHTGPSDCPSPEFPQLRPSLPPADTASINSKDAVLQMSSTIGNLLERMMLMLPLPSIAPAQPRTTAAIVHSGDQSVIQALKAEKNMLKKKLTELQTRLELENKAGDELNLKLNALSLQYEKSKTFSDSLEDRIATLSEQVKAAANEKEKNGQGTTEPSASLPVLTPVPTSKKGFETASGLLSDAGSLTDKTETKNSSTEDSDLNNDAGRNAYVFGQSVASALSSRLRLIRDTGIEINNAALINGFRDGIAGKSIIDDNELIDRYQTIQELQHASLEQLVTSAYEKIDDITENRKPVQKNEDIRWYLLKAGEGKIEENHRAGVHVYVETQDKRVINDFTDEQVLFDKDLPTLMFEGIKIAGKKGRVEAWALAKDIMDVEPLPDWITPYDIIHYTLTVK